MDYALRYMLARRVIEMDDVVLVVYEDQLNEVKRAVNDLAVRGMLGSPLKLEALRRIHEDFKELLEALSAAGRVLMVPALDVIPRASVLYRVAERRLGGQTLRKLRRMSTDLAIIASAEKHQAAVVTRDYWMYKVYCDALRDRAMLPALYYLVVDAQRMEACYRVCGNVQPPLEHVLDEVCRALGLRRRRC